MNIETSCQTPFPSKAKLPGQTKNTHYALFIADSTCVGDGKMGGNATHHLIFSGKIIHGHYLKHS